MQSTQYFPKQYKGLFICGLLSILTACGGGTEREIRRDIKCLNKNSDTEIINCLEPTPTPAATITQPATPTPRPTTQTTTPQKGFVSIAPDIKLEYLDFGGAGDPILLLAGAGNSAHVFDGFAQGLTAKNRVFALTRRGYGASSQPATGYDTATLTKDIRIALDQLGINRVHLIGHSIAGDEMTRFAGQYPERVNRLVYLDAAYDRVMLNSLLSRFTLPSPPDVTSADLASLDGMSRYTNRISGTLIPKIEMQAITRFASDGTVASLVTPNEITLKHLAGIESPNYSLVKARALGIFAEAQTTVDVVPWLTPASPEWGATSTFLSNTLAPFSSQQRAKFKTELIGSSTLTIPSANHYLFISNSEQVTAAILQFLATP